MAPTLSRTIQEHQKNTKHKILKRNMFAETCLFNTKNSLVLARFFYFSFDQSATTEK